MRSVRIPAVNWDEVLGARAVVPVKVDWPELRLTLDQITANAVADLNGEPRPFPDHSIFYIEIDRPVPA